MFMISTKPHVYDYDWHFENLQNSNVKFIGKKKCIWKMFIKEDFKNTNVMSVAKISHRILDWKYILSQLFMKEKIKL